MSLPAWWKFQFFIFPSGNLGSKLVEYKEEMYITSDCGKTWRQVHHVLLWSPFFFLLTFLSLFTILPLTFTTLSLHSHESYSVWGHIKSNLTSVQFPFTPSWTPQNGCFKNTTFCLSWFELTSVNDCISHAISSSPPAFSRLHWRFSRRSITSCTWTTVGSLLPSRTPLFPSRYSSKIICHHRNSSPSCCDTSFYRMR